MITLIPVGDPKPAQEKTFPNKMEFKNDVSNLSAVFHSAREARMGLYVWQLSVYDGDMDVTIDYSITDDTYNFLVPNCYAPWSYQGDVLCLATIDSISFEIRTKFYSFREKSFTSSEIGATSAILCSPTTPHVLLTGRIVNLAGTQIASIPQLKFLSWVKDTPNFIAVSREPDSMETWLYYFEATGTLLDKIPLDSTNLVPYDKEKYRSIARGDYTLVAPTFTAAGSLLDEWNEITYSLETGVFSLTVFRPVGDVIIRDNEQLVNVEELEVQFRFEIKN